MIEVETPRGIVVVNKPDNITSPRRCKMFWNNSIHQNVNDIQRDVCILRKITFNVEVYKKKTFFHFFPWISKTHIVTFESENEVVVIYDKQRGIWKCKFYISPCDRSRLEALNPCSIFSSNIDAIVAGRICSIISIKSEDILKMVF